MLGKITIVLATAAALTAGLTANAFAFSGGVSHVMTHPVAMTTGIVTAMPADPLSALVTSLSITRAIPGALHQTQPLRLMDEVVRERSSEAQGRRGQKEELQS